MRKTLCTRTENSLLKSVTSEFERGRNLICGIDDLAYRRSANHTGSVGEHFRHNLDFVNSFLNGIEEGRMDYNSRERDIRVEINRDYAVEKIDFAIGRLGGLDDEILERKIYVRSEINLANWLLSSIMRELEFLHSHTVHHHALIAEKLAGSGITVTDNFGVSPSTLEYRKRKAA